MLESSSMDGTNPPRDSRDEARAVRLALETNGFALVPGVLDAAEIAAVDVAAQALLAAAPETHFEANRTTGSMLSVMGAPSFAPLVRHASALQMLSDLGYGRVVWPAGYVISKPPGAPRLFWHQDWLYWDHPASREQTPHQLFAMYYLVDTHRGNGCLRVIPGSHRRRLPAHDLLIRAHSKDALAGTELSHPTFGDLPGEVDVPVKAGDLLLGDSRLLHSAHANDSGERRTLITLWYHPAWDKLPPEIRCSIRELAERSGLAASPDYLQHLGDLLPPVESGVAPAPINRVPRFDTVAR